MKQRVTAFFLCLILLLSLAGCKRQENTALKEESGGTGFGAVQKSVLTEQDLYFFTHSTTREQVLTALGNPQDSLLLEKNTETYLLKEGQTLKITYSDRDTVQTALYTDAAGKEQSLFDYLAQLGILKSTTPTPGTTVTTPDPETTIPETGTEGDVTVETTPAPEGETTTGSNDTGCFSNKTYSYAMAEQILALGVTRETVVSALGKPNRFSSVTFAKDSYLVDVYVMKDGSILYLDYGYLRNELRAVRRTDGGTSTNYLGTWGAEAKPEGFYRITKNKSVFKSVKKGTTPAALYRRFGEPDWLEGKENDYQAAYQLQDGAVLYFDFGTNQSSLTGALIRNNDGTVSVFALE